MFWLFGHEIYSILAPRPGIETVPPVLEGEVLNHWTARKVLLVIYVLVLPPLLPLNSLRVVSVSDSFI